MRIIAFKTLRQFYEKHPECEEQLKTWYHDAMHANWRSPQDIKKEYPKASIIGDNRVVFNIHWNDYRLVVRFNYKYGWGWIRFIGRHSEYDKIDAEKI